MFLKYPLLSFLCQAFAEDRCVRGEGCVMERPEIKINYIALCGDRISVPLIVRREDESTKSLPLAERMQVLENMFGYCGGLDLYP